MTGRKYKFSWDLLGDIALGRPNLGPNTRLEVYRLMQFTFRDVIEQHLGTEKTDQIFYEAGKLAGTEFYKKIFSNIKDFNAFIKSLGKHSVIWGSVYCELKRQIWRKGSLF